MRKLFGTDGIRGVAGVELGCRDAMRIGEALGRVLREVGAELKVCVGWDTRISSEMLGTCGSWVRGAGAWDLLYPCGSLRSKEREARWRSGDFGIAQSLRIQRD